MLENPDSEQDYWSKTPFEGLYKVGQDNIRLLKNLIYYDLFLYDKMNYFDFLGSIVKAVK